MKTNRFIVRLIAVAAMLAMLLSFVGCANAYNNDPTVVKCGSVKLGLRKYMNYFQNSAYYQYYKAGYIDAETYKNLVMDQLVSYGVQLDQVKKQGITLTSEEEAKVQDDVEAQIKTYLDENYKDSIDKSLTDADEIYEAEMKLLLKDLKDNGSNFKKFRAELEDNIRNTALVEKLRDSVVGDITVSNDDVKKYFDDNMSTATTIANFNSSFGSFITGSSQNIPYYMPVVGEKAEAAEGEEAQEPNPYDELFSVFHLLVKFETKAGEDVTDYPAYAAEDTSVSKNMSMLEERLPELTAEQFLSEYCFGDVCEDPGMKNTAYQFFGYTMAESLISSYYEGWGNAAMMLKYPEWEPKAEETDSSDTSEEKPEIDHDYTRLTLGDGTEIMRVFTDTGVHYIILNTNNWNAMYNEEGKLMIPIYDGDQLVKEGDSIVTTAGNISQEVFDAIELALSSVGDKADADRKEVSAKSLYDTIREAALTTAQNAAYNDKYTEWKEATKIVIKDNIIKNLSIG